MCRSLQIRSSVNERCKSTTLLCGGAAQMKKVLEIFPLQPLILLQATLDGHTREVATYVLAKEGAVLVGHLQHSALGNLLPPTVLNERLVTLGIDKAAELGAVQVTKIPVMMQRKHPSVHGKCIKSKVAFDFLLFKSIYLQVSICRVNFVYILF